MHDLNRADFVCQSEAIWMKWRRLLRPTWRQVLLFFTNMEKVKTNRRGTKISEKHQVTIPIDAMRVAGLEAGERVIARADGPGRVVLEREEDVLESFSGSLTGAFEHGILEQLRNEWD
ncbi:MAG: AbrB/MazE/SpoVT family DNA-binding domain-containing protein [Acidobacteria bacterium]|nr:AbrB/MazE/SpoVT family DNA-binding domain-containing protein [Acidobacteriota bacterium]